MTIQPEQFVLAVGLAASVLDAGADSALLRIVATLSLTFVLFTDAVSLNFWRAREHRFAAFLVLVPGRPVCLTGREHERPCGARVAARRMARGARARWRAAAMARMRTRMKTMSSDG
ncbi:MAG: hypothetical protein M3R55_09225 [Acidobacteriota bacterium]|nr:hypothetical protein [Acidobacteriota bacterium]